MPITLPPPPTVLLGAQLWRDDGLQGSAVSGQAVAIRGNRIVAVGPREEILRQFPKALAVDLPGGTLLPGFIEGHAHVAGVGRQHREADLAGVNSLAEVLTRIRAWSAAHPGSWLQGRGWDQNLWPTQTFPTAADLDTVTGKTPAVLARVDGHAYWVNSAALAAAGITRATPDPRGGRILRSAQGEATGILMDAAMDLMDRHSPHPSGAELEGSLMEGLGALEHLGFTAVSDMGVDRATLAAYRRLDHQRRLPIRVFAYLAHDPALMIRELKTPRDLKTSFFQVQGVKFYLDGALGSRGARLLAPYQDDPGQGLWVTDPVHVAQDVKVTVKAGYQPAIHAIGDAANRAALDLLPRTPRGGLPGRIEHAQIVTAEDAARFGKKGIVASIQPMHCTDDHAWTPSRLGPERLKEAYPWRAFLQGGAILALGSDAPIADPNPFQGLAAAETRMDAAGDPPGGFLPTQRLTREEALRGYLLGNARALGRKDLGALNPGALADLVWVQAPVTHLPVEELRKLKPGRMWINGVEVH